MTFTRYEAIWMEVGFVGQFIFTGRFVVQWAAFDKKKESVVPVTFWWVSLFGGLTLFTFALHKSDPPFILGQRMVLFVSIRNLMLVSKARRSAAKHEVPTKAWLAYEAIPAPHQKRPRKARSRRRGYGVN